MSSIPMPPELLSKKARYGVYVGAVLTYLHAEAGLSTNYYAILLTGLGIGLMLSQGVADLGKEKEKLAP